MKVHYIACASSSSLDSNTNQLSLFHMLDEIGARSFPINLANLCVAALFEREPDEEETQTYQLAMMLDGALLASFSMQVDFGRARRNRAVNTIQGLSIPAAGTLTLRLLQKADVLATWTIPVIALGAVAGAPPPDVKRSRNEAKLLEARTSPTVN